MQGRRQAVQSGAGTGSVRGVQGEAGGVRREGQAV